MAILTYDEKVARQRNQHNPGFVSQVQASIKAFHQIGVLLVLTLGVDASHAHSIQSTTRHWHDPDFLAETAKL